MSKRLRIIILIFLLQVAGSQILKAQDLHFSQWFNEPLLTNPANTGFIPDGITGWEPITAISGRRSCQNLTKR